MWHLFLLEKPVWSASLTQNRLGSLGEPHAFHFIFCPLLGREGGWGGARQPPDAPPAPQTGHTASHAQQHPSGAPEGPPGPTPLLGAVLFRWLQEGTRRLLLTPRPWPLAEGGQGPGDGGPGCGVHPSRPLESGEHLGSLGRGPRRPLSSS